MTSKIKMFKYGFMHIQKCYENPGNTVVTTNLVFDPLMTSNNLKQPKMTSKMKIINYGFMHIQQKLGKPREYSSTNKSSVWPSNDL